MLNRSLGVRFFAIDNFTPLKEDLNIPALTVKLSYIVLGRYASFSHNTIYM